MLNIAGTQADRDLRFGQFADQQRHDRLARYQAEGQRDEGDVDQIDRKIPAQVFLYQGIHFYSQYSHLFLMDHLSTTIAMNIAMNFLRSYRNL